MTDLPKRIYRKRIPYGMQNFEDVMKEDCYYVDKTPFVERIEDAHKYFFFIRPRRFGKSLTISMLENYYDINKKDKFESIFGKLYIGQHPTPERNSYLIIHLNFAEVNAGIDDYKKGLDGYCNIMFESCCRRYAHLLPLCDIYKDMRDSYIIELKYCKTSTTDEQVAQLFTAASEQVLRYADSDTVRSAVKTTTLHKIVVIYRGAEMAVCDEAKAPF